jgi:biotin operon repressor
MQTQIPIFPEETKLINSTLGFREQDGFVYYLHNGNPIYCHSKQDRNSYRFILGNLVSNHLCSISELSDALGENRKNIERYAQRFREKGAEDFFSRKETRGQCYKMHSELIQEIQQRLDEGWSKYKIAQKYGISESAISYHIKKGTLKKKQMFPQ